MKNLLFLTLFISTFSFGQVITDSILGKPKFVKEYVVFLNESGPFTFMQGDDAYGHSIVPTPDNLRGSMRGSWFYTNFCRYTNNETYYDKDKRITKETWFYKSGEVLDIYKYKYDYFGRIVNELNTNKFLHSEENYFYLGNSNKLKFKERISKWEDEPEEFVVKNMIDSQPYLESRYNSETKTDSIFQITDRIYKQVGERSFTNINDAVFHRKLYKVNIYNEKYQIIDMKTFNFGDDHYNKKVSLSEHKKYEYDSKGRKIKEIYFSDGKYYYYSINANGHVLNEETFDNTRKSFYISFKYDEANKLLKRTRYYEDKISTQEDYFYNGKYIAKLLYFESGQKQNKNPSIITFKYKFDKHENWIECTKNVDGKDLYLWKREIQYY